MMARWLIFGLLVVCLCLPTTLVPAALGPVTGLSPEASGDEPTETFALHPENPRYFLFRGKPTILITSGEHYGAVLNLDFDYTRYLDALQADGLNHTRTWLGTYREIPGSFNIEQNTLAPRPQRYSAPWQRSDRSGYFDGGNKFDLAKWDEAHFARLKDFLRQAAQRGIVVELNLFCPNYNDDLWKANPMHAENNVNGLPVIPANEVYTLKHQPFVAVHEAVTRKVVKELNEFDNLYYEICNEPYFGGVTMAWQDRIVAVIVETERDLPNRHLISLNIANGRQRVERPLDHVSLYNFHYCHPPDVIALNAHLNRPIGENETGFRGQQDVLYRTEGWDFIVAGGALYNNLDYSFTVDHPDGQLSEFRAPGGGGPTLRRQLGFLKSFIERFDFINMQPRDEVVRGGVPPSATARVLAELGQQYVVYLKGGTQANLQLELPSGQYAVQWFHPDSGAAEVAHPVQHDGGILTVESPEYQEDLALSLRRTTRP